MHSKDFFAENVKVHYETHMVGKLSHIWNM